jgi:AcrR family transcriptional regulator
LLASERLFVVEPWDDSQHPVIMRYQPGHKAKIHQKIVEDASELVRAAGLSGAAVSAVMRDTGLTHGGFYKHFRSKDDLLVESLSEAFREFTDTLVRVAEQSPSGQAWKAIVKIYLRPEFARSFPSHVSAPEINFPIADHPPTMTLCTHRIPH